MINRREANALRGRKNCVSSTVPKNLSIEGHMLFPALSWSACGLKAGHVYSSQDLCTVTYQDCTAGDSVHYTPHAPLQWPPSGLHSRGKGQCPLQAPPQWPFWAMQGTRRIPQEENWMNMYPLVTTTTAPLYVITHTSRHQSFFSTEQNDQQRHHQLKTL